MSGPTPKELDLLRKANEHDDDMRGATGDRAVFQYGRVDQKTLVHIGRESHAINESTLDSLITHGYIRNTSGNRNFSTKSGEFIITDDGKAKARSSP